MLLLLTTLTIMIRWLRRHIILLRIPIIHTSSNLFFYFSGTSRIPSTYKLSGWFLFIFYYEIFLPEGFFFWNRWNWIDVILDVILVKELFLIFLHELCSGVAFKFSDVVAIWLSESSDFLVAFLWTWWNISIRFYGEIIPWKLPLRIQPQRKIIFCSILWTL